MDQEPTLISEQSSIGFDEPPESISP